MTTDGNSRSQSAEDQVNSEISARETLMRLMPELEALKPEELVQITVDVRSAVATALGALPKIRKFRDFVVVTMPEFDVSAFDKLEDCAIALNQADDDYLSAPEVEDDLDDSVREALRSRELLLADTRSFILRGVIQGANLAELKGPIGHKNLASDLGVLASLLQSNWERIQGRTALQEDDLARAAKLSLHIVRGVGMRAQRALAVTAVADIRVRAFTLLAKNYNQVRRAISYFRWEQGDLNKIAPSLFAKRRGRRKSRAAARDELAKTTTESTEPSSASAVVPPRENAVVPPRENAVVPPRENAVVPPRESAVVPPRESPGEGAGSRESEPFVDSSAS